MILNDLVQKIQALYPPPYIIKDDKPGKGVDGRIVAYSDKDSYIAEQYRVLQTNLYVVTGERRIKTIVITSSQKGEGKTTTACNLAMTLASDPAKKVLLVDFDLRKPDVHKLLNIAQEPGLSDIIMGKRSVAEITAKPAVGNLYVIPSGSAVANPPEFLRHPKAQETVDEIKKRFDYAIFDTPPTIGVADSRIVGPMCDGVILVVRAGDVPKSAVEESYDLLERAHVKPIGFIMTDFQAAFYQHAKHRSYYAGK